MQSFISQTLDHILKTTTSFEDVIFILPSQRAKVFVKQALKDKIEGGFLPEILNIEQFISRVSGLQKADSIQLLFHFYTLYKSLEKAPVSFDIFASWAFTVLQDFNDIDQHLINARDIFIYLRDIQRLKKWSVKGEFKETELMKDHYSFLENLDTYYSALYQFLQQKKIGYQGLIFRESCKKIDQFLQQNSHKKLFLIGFNALNKAEEFLFQKVLENEYSEIYWDIDIAFFNSNHQAGKFIRKYKAEWSYYEKNDVKILGSSFAQPKNIEVIGTSKNTTQIKYAGELLENFSDFSNTALVLADETLLPIMLNSLPKNIDAINITMGYPLKDLPTTNLIASIFQLFLSQEKLQKTLVNDFYYKDVLRFLKHESIYKLLSDIHFFTDEIAAKNQSFIKQDHLRKLFETTTEELKIMMNSIFNPYTSIEEFIDRILHLIKVLKKEVSDLEKEYLFRFHTTFTQLKTLHNEYKYFPDLKTLFLFFRQLIASESLSFQGEPLKGLQLMGMLETRVLDFENIVLVSSNEGVLPAGSQQKSFIPFDVKLAFDIPTYREKDAIFSYHFFRLMQRAKNIFLIYNTEHDVFGSGEKSRFISQLEMMRTDVVQKVITPKVLNQKPSLKSIAKNEFVIERLRELAKKGISPSALTNYLYNPISFYKQKILQLKEFEDVEETIAYTTLGTVVHQTLDELYTPFVGKFLQTGSLSLMEKKVKELVVKHFRNEYKNGDITSGKNRLIFEVAVRFVHNFLAQEKELLKDAKNQLKILATEENLATELHIEGLDYPIKIHGQVDRVDELNGVLRIIDYKTGMVSSSDLRVSSFERLREKEQYKAIQVLMYAYIYTQSNKDYSKQSLQAGIYSFKNLHSGFLAVDFSSNYRKPMIAITAERLDEFIAEIKKYLKEIYTLQENFTAPAELKY